MELIGKRVVESGCRSRGELVRRLDFWANRYGFARSEREGDAFVYTRGSQLSALYTFDIRKLPTEVNVTLVPDGAGICLCTHGMRELDASQHAGG